MKEIDLAAVSFQKRSEEYDYLLSTSALVRMLTPKNLDFELELRSTGIEVKPYKWILISLDP